MLTLLNSSFRLGIFLLNRLTCKDHDMASAFLSSSILILRSLQEMNVEHLGLFSRSVKAQQPWYQIWDLGTKNKRAYSSSMYVYHSLSPEKNKARSLLRFLSLSLFFFFMMMLVTQYRIALCMCTLYYYYAMMAAASPSASRPLSLCPSG